MIVALCNETTASCLYADIPEALCELLSQNEGMLPYRFAPVDLREGGEDAHRGSVLLTLTEIAKDNGIAGEIRLADVPDFWYESGWAR